MSSTVLVNRVIDQEDLIDRVRVLTSEVHQSILDGDWDRAAKLERSRRSAIESLFSADESLSVETIGALNEQLDLSNKLTGFAMHERQKVLRDASMLRSRQSAAKAYADQCVTSLKRKKP